MEQLRSELTARELKTLLTSLGVSVEDCVEKAHFIENFREAAGDDDESLASLCASSVCADEARKGQLLRVRAHDNVDAVEPPRARAAPDAKAVHARARTQD